MSYSFSFTAPKPEVLDVFDEHAARSLESSPEDVQTEVAEHLEDARAALAIQVRRVGGPDVEVSVSVDGHANPGHEPRAGWANDALAVRVTETHVATPAAG